MDLTGANWRKSSYSSNSGNCVEAALLPDMIAVRDSKNPDGPALVLGRNDWAAFIGGIRAGDFD